MKYLLLSLLMFSNIVFATPAKFEVWFLSIDRETVLKQFLPNPSKGKSIQVAQNGSLQCEPMGEYCFDPQIGLYKKDDKKSAQDSLVDQSVLEEGQKYDFLPAGDSVNRNLINCDKKNGFDIFCGQTKRKVAKSNTKLEVWIDVSTTMKQVDFSGFDKKCNRELFLERMNESCPMNQSMKVYYFNEARKEAGSFDRACISNGLNNMNRLLEEVKNIPKSKKLIIVTDIFEANAEFISNIESMGGVTKGVDEPIYAKNLLTDLKRLKSLCK